MGDEDNSPKKRRKKKKQGRMLIPGCVKWRTRVCWLLWIWFLDLAAATRCSSELKSSLGLAPNADPEEVVHTVDRMIQIHAFRALLRPHTGTVYDVPLPMGIQPGLSVQAVRLKTASLQHRGFIFNEFIIPPRIAVTTRVNPGGEVPPEYVVLVYRFFSMRFSAYCPKNGLSIIGPVVGIRAYSGMDMEDSTSGRKVPIEAEVVALDDPITVRVPIFPLSDSNKVNPAMCALFDGNGNTTVTPMTYVNVCSMYQLGDATLVNFSSNSSGESWSDSIEAPAPAPEEAAAARAPSPSSRSSTLPSVSSTRARKERSSSSSTRVKDGILGAMGAVTAVIFGALTSVAALRVYQASVVSRMEVVASECESLGTTLISYNARPPTARASRTRPCLERDYIFR